MLILFRILLLFFKMYCLNPFSVLHLNVYCYLYCTQRAAIPSVSQCWKSSSSSPNWKASGVWSAWETLNPLCVLLPSSAGLFVTASLVQTPLKPNKPGRTLPCKIKYFCFGGWKSCQSQELSRALPKGLFLLLGGLPRQEELWQSFAARQGCVCCGRS